MGDSAAIQDEIDQFTADLLREDEMGAVIRAHIRIENLLLRTVESLLPFPEHLPKLNLDYDGLVTLALALGLKPRFGPPFRSLGKLRNDFAHKLSTSLDKQSVTNLYKALGTEEKDQVQAMFRNIQHENEETRHITRFSELKPADQFTLMAVSLWGVVRAAVRVNEQEH